MKGTCQRVLTFFGAIAVLGLVPVQAHAAPAYVQASTPNGVILVKKATGEIIYCPGLSTSGGSPTGSCGSLGTLPSALNTADLQINAGGTSVFLTNLATGASLQCSLLISSYGSPVGNCRVRQMP
jgi:hypothetical protein